MRPLRIEFENAWYHVMNRGTNHQCIFFTDEHREIFLNLLEDIAEKFYTEIHAYCLMDNHYHLLIKTPLPNLGKIMQYLDGVYTQCINRLVKRDGSLFRGRYKAILVEEESYLLQLSRYIHLNPVSAKICKEPAHFKWSSYQFYIHPDNKPKWIQTNTILKMINEENSYALFVADGLDEEIKEFYNKTQIPTILGSDHFKEKHTKFLNKNIKEACSADIKRCQKLPDFEKIIEAAINYFKITQHDIYTSMPGKINIYRMIVIYLSRQLGQLSYQKISNNIGIKPVSVGTALKRFEKIKKENSKVKMELNELTNLILNCN